MDKFSKKIGDCQSLAFSINNALGAQKRFEDLPAGTDPLALVPSKEKEQLIEQLDAKEKEELKYIQGVVEDSKKMQEAQEDTIRKICARIDMQSEKYKKIEEALSLLATMPDEIDKIKTTLQTASAPVDVSELQTKMNERMEDLEKKYRSIKFSPKKPESDVEEKEAPKKAEKPAKIKKTEVTEDNIDAK